MSLPNLSLLGRLSARRPPAPPGLLETLARPGVHEQALTALFDGRMRFEGTAPEFDRPLVLVAFTNRSGSNLVCDYLRQAGRAGGAGEHLNHPVAAERQGSRPVDSLPAYLRALHAELAPQGRSLALKASWDQMAMLLRGNIPAMFPRTVVLHCLRNDTLAQAVSYSIALRSGSWISRQPGAAVSAADIPGGEIERQMESFQRANLLIRLLCEAHGLPRRDVGYERLCTDNGAHLTQILLREGLAAPGWRPGAAAIERQSGPLNAQLAGDFLAAARRAIGPGRA